MKTYIYPYTTNSESAKLLAERLGAKRIKLSNSEYTHKPDNLVINWGNSNCPITGDRVLNQAKYIKQTVDKLSFFRLMMKSGLGGYLPRYWTNSEDVPDDAFPVFCRTTVTGMDGEGIVIATTRDELVAASLYTSFVNDTLEYRVTLFRNTVTDIQTKLPRFGETPHPMIKTFKNGWGFQRRTVLDVIKGKIVAAAMSALKATDLDFAGIDILYDTVKGRAYILEVNTAPGLEGEALNLFAEAVEEHVKATYPTQVPEPLPMPLYGAPTGSESISTESCPIIRACMDQNWAKVIQMAAERLV